LRFSVSGSTFVTQVIFSLIRFFADSLTADPLISIFEGVLMKLRFTTES